MNTIWKFEITSESVQLVEMPHGSRPLKVGWDPYAKKAYLWAECDTRKPNVGYQVTVVGTGRDVPEMAGQYLGTVTYQSSVAAMLMQWHVYFNPEPIDGGAER